MATGEPLSPSCWKCSASREAAIPCWSHSLAVVRKCLKAQWILLAELALMVQPKENPTVISY